MHPQLNIALAQARHEDLAATAAKRRLRRRAERPEDQATAAISWAGLTLRLATGADRAALARLAELDWTAQSVAA